MSSEISCGVPLLQVLNQKLATADAEMRCGKVRKNPAKVVESREKIQKSWVSCPGHSRRARRARRSRCWCATGATADDAPQHVTFPAKRCTPVQDVRTKMDKGRDLTQDTTENTND